jgi:hypothetical protein
MFAEVNGFSTFLGILLLAWGGANLLKKCSDASDEKKKAAAKGGWDFVRWLLK